MKRRTQVIIEEPFWNNGGIFFSVFLKGPRRPFGGISMEDVGIKCPGLWGSEQRTAGMKDLR